MEENERETALKKNLQDMCNSTKTQGSKKDKQYSHLLSQKDLELTGLADEVSNLKSEVSSKALNITYLKRKINELEESNAQLK